ncbi:E3 ubiquitin-protein ligase PDZRN3-B-like [Kryptolebias marmoratus]|uniref:E3 ubiquitin-protein ligase PDZRN3-B-like n=1 Tax=Kryptolebias marmoratus TaxID=37003 RepID=UPI0018ACAF56|nr:E3 ubiquitin-protein ligase PDZRN3-B-like [Kryptolebias marmoratus]
MMEPQGQPNPAQGLCQKGCGLPLLCAEEHRCVEALRARTAALEERGAALERGARVQRLRWNRTERTLLAQVTTLQNEAQLAALKYQRRLDQYLLHINSIAKQIVGYCQSEFRAPDMQGQTSDKTCPEGELQKTKKTPQHSQLCRLQNMVTLNVL